jgi:hypothetical protein
VELRSISHHHNRIQNLFGQGIEEILINDDGLPMNFPASVRDLINLSDQEVDKLLS